MKYFETKYQKDSAKLTALFAILFILLIFIVGPTYLDPPQEYGVAVNFGNTDFGRGNNQPIQPLKSEPLDLNEQPNVKEVIPEDNVKQKVETEDILTDENAETLAMKKQKEAEAKLKFAAEAKAKEEAEKLEKERLEKEAKKKSIDNLIGGINKSEGKTSGSEGDDNTVGDKGQLNGNPYAPSYFGSPGVGNGGVGYGLNGRGKPTRTKVLPECNEEGRVVVEVHVNRQGKVDKAIAGKKGTTGDICLYEAAKKTAMSYKWPSDNNAPTTQIGFVIVDFSVRQ